jgi:hypothetical protein
MDESSGITCDFYVGNTEHKPFIRWRVSKKARDAINAADNIELASPAHIRIAKYLAIHTTNLDYNDLERVQILIEDDLDYLIIYATVKSYAVSKCSNLNRVSGVITVPQIADRSIFTIGGLPVEQTKLPARLNTRKYRLVKKRKRFINIDDKKI